MNPEPSQIAAVPAQLTPATTKNIRPLQSFLQKYLINTIIVSTCINTGLLGAATWSVWNTSQQLAANITRQDRQKELNNKVTYLDEVLTMSALMYVNTGQQTWEKRYNDTAPAFDQTFGEFTKTVANSPKLVAASKKLFEIEAGAFKLTKQGNLKAASLLLIGDEYRQNKQVHAGELDILVTKIKNAT